MEALALSGLLSEAIKVGAPLTEATVGKLSGHVLGSGRATRSSDVIIFNATNMDLHLFSNNCEWGGFVSNLFPEAVIPSSKSSVFGIESNGYMAGVSCKVVYKSPNGNSWVSFFISNPYIGAHEVQSESSSDLEIVETVGRGPNNQVRFLVKNNARSTTGLVTSVRA